MPDISYQEKTIWGSLITMAIAATVYFARVLAALGEEGPSPAGVTWFGLGLLFVLLVVETVYSILLAASSRVEKKDERDRTIDARADRAAYFVLVSGVIAAVFQIMMGGLFGEAAPKSFSPFVVANLLLLALVLSEITKFTYKLITYRRGV